MERPIQNRLLHGWPFFFLIAALTAVVIGIGFSRIGVATPEATIDMIRLSVQAAAPWIFITFAASSLLRLLPGDITRWLLRNRRYLGLSFAAGMGWQLIFIAVLFAQHAAYYWEVLHNPIDLFLRIASYGVLIALTVTSFYPVRRKMQREHIDGWRDYLVDGKSVVNPFDVETLRLGIVGCEKNKGPSHACSGGTNTWFLVEQNHNGKVTGQLVEKVLVVLTHPDD
jgi:hypothetical protein